MPRVKVSIHDRVNAFKNEKFYVSDSTILMCGVCNTRLDWEKKDALDKHVKSSTHTRKKLEQEKLISEKGQTSKRQTTVLSIFENQKRSGIEKNEFVEDAVKMCMQANIPLEKMDHPAVRTYLDKYVRGSGDLPGADTLRQEYMPKVGAAEKERLKELIQGKDIYIVADETSDSRGRCVFVILFRTNDSAADQQVYLAMCCFLDSANGTTCSQAILECLNQYGVAYENVRGLVSDSARYMSTCFAALQIVMGDHAIHFQCWAHKVNLVGDVFMHEFSDVNALVVDVKMAFLHGKKIKSGYILFLQENFPELAAKLFPSPVVTRWNSWFMAVIYLSDYIDALLQFFDQWEPQNSSVKSVCQKLSGGQFPVLKVKCKFVSEACKKIVDLIKVLEGGHYPFAHLLWDELTQISDQLRRYADGVLPSHTQQMLHEVKGDAVKASIKSAISNCCAKSCTKLSTHMAPSPANNFYTTAGELFNPAKAGQQAELNCKKLSVSKAKLPPFSKISADQFMDGYMYFHEQLKGNVRAGNKIDMPQLLLAVSITKPEFGAAALKTIWAPVSSVDAERCLSSYNVVLSDRRTSLKQENIEMCNILKFN